MNQKRSLIEAARLKKKAEADDNEIKRQVDDIRHGILTMHQRGAGSKRGNSTTQYSSRVEGDYGAYEWTQ